MRRTILIGMLLFVGFALAFAPAGLMRLAFNQLHGVTMTQAAGTIWHGQGRLLLEDRALGLFKWELRPSVLLRGALGVDFTLVHAADPAGPPLAGWATVGFGRTYELELSGTIPAEVVSSLLAPYDMAITGDLNLNGASLSGNGGVPTSAAGQVTWAGGSVSYILSGRSLSSNLPPLVAYLGDGAQATVFAQNGQIPLIRAELLDNGFAKVGITKLLTKMLDNPWPGSDPDHAIVLEVEEQVF